MTVTIESLDHQGRGIAKYNGQVLFVENALPKEVVKIKIIRSKKHYGEAIVTEYQVKSPLRKTPLCPYFGICGGCDLMHLSAAEQVKFKEEKVKNIMKKYSDLESVVKPLIPSQKTIRYRNKITLQVENRQLGFYQKSSNTIVPISYCYLVSEQVNRWIKELSSLPLDHIRQIVIRTNEKGEGLIYLETNGAIEEDKYRAFGSRENISVVTSKKVLCGKEYLEESLLGLRYRISPTAFFQVNHDQTEVLYRLIHDLAFPTEKDNIWDLYCGTGSIGLSLAKYAQTVYGVEQNQAAVQDANRNKEINHIDNISFLSGDVGKQIDRLPKPDIIIVDPPRSGLGVSNVEKLLSYQASKIIYVSCDPMTLARDLSVLKTQYQVVEIIPVDMFPETSHVECVCVLKRR